MLRKIIILIIILSLTNCAAERKIFVKKNKIPVYLAFFDNKTYKPKINEILTLGVSQIILTSDILKNVNKIECQYLIRGTVTNYSITPKIYDYNDVVQMYKMSVGVTINILKQTEPEKYEPYTNFSSESSIIYSETNMSKENEEQAFNRLKEMASIKIYKKIRNSFK
jgi:hypothetical protein